MKSIKKPDKAGMILTVVTVLMTIVFAFSLLFLMMTIRQRNYDEPFGANSFVRYLREGKYSELIDAYHENITLGADSPEYAPYYAAARYCEDAAYYKVSSENGDKERCEALLAEMKELISGLKETEIILEDVNKTFGIPL